jgi:hypothetical protein
MKSEYNKPEAERISGEILPRIILNKNYPEIPIFLFDLPDYTSTHTHIYHISVITDCYKAHG